jgi:hypothetical protein
MNLGAAEPAPLQLDRRTDVNVLLMAMSQNPAYCPASSQAQPDALQKKLLNTSDLANVQNAIM